MSNNTIWLICTDIAISGYFISKKQFSSWKEAENEYKYTVFAKSFVNVEQILEFLIDDQIIITSQAKKIRDFANDPTREVMDLAELKEDSLLDK